MNLQLWIFEATEYSLEENLGSASSRAMGERALIMFILDMFGLK